ncbi:MAG: OmpA family protein [Chitinophagales bacterium]
MSQILNALKAFVTPELVGKMASQLGEGNGAISKGLNALIPTLLGGMASKTGDSNLISNIFNLVKGSDSVDVKNNLKGGSGNDLTSKLMSMVFGGKVNDIIGSIAYHAGLKNGSVQNLLGMVGPMVMGHFSKLIGSKGLDASGFASLLNQEKSGIMAALPSELNKTLGFTASKGSTTGRRTDNVRVAVPKEKKKGGIGKILIPLLLLGALAFGAYYFLAGPGKGKAQEKMPAVKEKIRNAADATKDAARNAADATKDAAKNTVDATKNVVAGLGKFADRKLANGVALNIPTKGVENQLVTFIEDKSKAIDKTTWFNFDRLTFAVGGSKLDIKKSKDQLENIAAIMKAYPNTKIKIGGYTDNTGSEEANIKISQARADAVMGALNISGVAKNRMEAEGYGPKHAIAPNDTKKNQAKNRRIAIRFTAK